ncbi:MAG TPA: ABC transporter ATP-binding protein [Candidatus Bathyarchaeia archaeon]|nr:ABC transporter ATP-binding protein [Candidatus Bathyarchaeia archaeon]
MLNQKNNPNTEAEVIFWAVFYFNPIATKETDQFKREVIKTLRKNKLVDYDFEELTAFLVLKIQLNSNQIAQITSLTENRKEDLANLLLEQIQSALKINYKTYLSALKNRFLKEMKKNRELKESTNILIKKMTMNEDEKTCFADNIYKLIEDKSEYYEEVVENALLFISSAPKENYSIIEIGSEKVTVQSEEPIIHLLDELILYNFASKYSGKTEYILKQFLTFSKAVNKKLQGTTQKTQNFIDLLDLLKGKSFEVLDNIYDIRRQIARQSRAESEIISEITKLNNPELVELIEKISPRKIIQEIVKLTDESIESLHKWFEYIREIENITIIEPMMNLKDYTDEICSLFIHMELLRIWSEFFYDISYFTVKEGRVVEAVGEEVKKKIETEAVLKVENVYKTYKLPKSRVYALRGVSFEIKQGEFLAIMGPSGAGKTTLVNILTGLDTPDKGAVYLDGKNIALLDDKELTIFRRDQIGLIFQFYQLFPELTAIENVSMPAEMAGIPVKEAREKALEILKVVDLEMFANQYPDKLSGGQQQRVAIARALVNDPSIIVADQLTGDLDSITGMQIIGYLRKINLEKRTTVLLVTHNKAVATQTDRILTIEDGEIMEEIDMTKLRQMDK